MLDSCNCCVTVSVYGGLENKENKISLKFISDLHDPLPKVWVGLINWMRVSVVLVDYKGGWPITSKFHKYLISVIPQEYGEEAFKTLHNTHHISTVGDESPLPMMWINTRAFESGVRILTFNSPGCGYHGSIQIIMEGSIANHPNKVLLISKKLNHHLL